MNLVAGYRVRVGEREGVVSESPAGKQSWIRVGFDDGRSELLRVDEQEIELIDASNPLESARLGSIKDERYAS